MVLGPDESLAYIFAHGGQLARQAWEDAGHDLTQFCRVVLPPRSAIAYLEGILLRQLTWFEVVALVRAYRCELHNLNVQHELDELER